MASPQVVETFHWTETRQVLGPWASRGRFQFDRDRQLFLSDDGGPEWLRPPLAIPLPPEFAARSGGADESAQAFARRRMGRSSASDLETYLDALPEELPLQCVILLQAGAASVGMFRGGEPIATKSFKRYVVRGSGRAQPTYLGKKGKSRYGARLRLQNARKMIDDTATLLNRYWKEHGVPAQVLASAPKRHWADLWNGTVSPPIRKEDPVTRIPMDVDVPITDVLLRTYRSLCYGRIERPTAPNR